MDGLNFEHSDSDSGESWTLLDQSPSYADDAPDFPTPTSGGFHTQNTEKDEEDTDGISIISDSENEHALLIEQPELESGEYARPAEVHDPNILAEHISTNIIKNNHNESVRGMDEFFGDNSERLKTYVHRRNKRLSTVLNIIMLGSVITAAGVAIGHMWGAKNDCSLQAHPSVNKILSNLYKLQEENAYLRNKLKEFALLNNVHNKPVSIKLTAKNSRCKKVFEETLNNKKTDRFVKCLDEVPPEVNTTPMIAHDYEREYLNDVNKLKAVYEQNKTWLDEEIAWKMKEGIRSQKRLKRNIKLSKIPEEKKSTVNEKLVKSAEKTETFSPGSDSNNMFHGLNNKSPTKISYADSLKVYNILEGESDETHVRNVDFKPKRKSKKNLEVIIENVSDFDFQKDDRYNKNKPKYEKKKYDRQKSYKKQKRRNKYEQWEMKDGYLKDYDDISIPSVQDNEYIMRNIDKNVASREFERNNYVNQFTNNIVKQEVSKPKTEERVKDLDWFEKRASSRKQARKRVERELFGEASPNSAWYFRRMARREQCRVKGDNSTFMKLAKRNMNYKTKR